MAGDEVDWPVEALVELGSQAIVASAEDQIEQDEGALGPMRRHGDQDRPDFEVGTNGAACPGASVACGRSHCVLLAQGKMVRPSRHRGLVLVRRRHRRAPSASQSRRGLGSHDDIHLHREGGG